MPQRDSIRNGVEISDFGNTISEVRSEGNMLLRLKERFLLSRKNKILRIAVILTIIGLGYGMLVGLFPKLNIDNLPQYGLFMVLAILIHWFGISFGSTNLNAGFSLIFSSFLIFGSVPAVWIGTLGSLFANGIINRGQPLRQTVFNGAQTSLTVTLAAHFYALFGGLKDNSLSLENWLPLTVFVLSYFLLNHYLVNFYLTTYSKKDRHWWKRALGWDFILFLLSIPMAVLLTTVYKNFGLTFMVFAFFPVLVLQKLTQVFLNLDSANRELKALYQVTKTIGTELDLQKTLDTILVELKNIMNYHSGIIYLFNESREGLLPRAVDSPYKKEIMGEEIHLGEGLVGLVAKTKEAELIEDILEEPNLAEMQGVTRFLRSLLIVPMLVSNQIVGVIAIGSKNRGEFSEDQLKILSILAGQAAVATANSLLYKKVGDLAVTDGLTKVYNHRFFYNKLEEELVHCKQHGQPLAVMLIDIDRFKRFNDRFGHLAGDMALNIVANLVKRYCRSRDTLARYGGEEFALILPGTDLNGALQVAERIRGAVSAYPFKPSPDYPGVTLSVSIGVTACQEQHNIKDLVEAADKALYQAKKFGRNRVEISKN